MILVESNNGTVARDKFDVTRVGPWLGRGEDNDIRSQRGLPLLIVRIQITVVDFSGRRSLGYFIRNLLKALLTRPYLFATEVLNNVKNCSTLKWRLLYHDEKCVRSLWIFVFTNRMMSLIFQNCIPSSYEHFCVAHYGAGVAFQNYKGFVIAHNHPPFLRVLRNIFKAISKLSLF